MFRRNGSTKTTRPAPGSVKANWPLIVGASLIGFILLLAIFGPSLAPNDPREQKLIIQVDGKWMVPPYPAFTPGYPLGSDNLGRDLYSWLLWSVRPTMLLVMVVAAIRMALGLAIGVSAGWSDGWRARFFDGLITAALSVPALIAALIVITAVGFHLGVWAFVAGLAITGWAETAQLVREQTRTIKGQQAVEAAHALGAGNQQIFWLHILPQVMPMIWMLLAFEISNTLVTTAGLGFLGYYLGGAVFMEVDDFVYQRISEMPELGQMLATAWMVLDEPWAMVAAGTIVFIIVLAFNLLGEGLQQRLTRHLGGTRRFYKVIAGEVLPRLDDLIGKPIESLTQRRGFRPVAAIVLVAVIGGGVMWWRGNLPEPVPTATQEVAGDSQNTTHGNIGTPTPENAISNNGVTASKSALPVPGGHIYANEGHDPWQTHWLDFDGPITTTIQWTFESSGFTGGPAIDAAGTLYISAKDGIVYALDGDANVLWETAVPAQPVGSPALAADGTVYVADKAGLNALSPDGNLLWRFVPEDGKSAVDGPIVGPDGTVYYKSFSSLLAVDAEGKVRWQASMPESTAAQPPRISPDGNLIFWQEFTFNSTDGSPYIWDDVLLLGEGLPHTLVGADGNLYHRYDQLTLRLVPTDTELSDAILFDWREYTWEGSEAGVTPHGNVWLAGRPPTGGMGLGYFWGTPDGTLDGKWGVPQGKNVRVIGVDARNVGYLCSDSYQTHSWCVGYEPGNRSTAWRVDFRRVNAISGAALAPGRMYVATWEGELFAVGAADPPLPDAGATADAEVPTLVDSALPVPGGHLWATERHDPWGTLWIGTTGPMQPDIVWTFEADAGLLGGPAVAADGTVYVGSEAGTLYALDAVGQVLWETTLFTGSVGSPALDADGNLYAVDVLGGLSAINSTGEVLWRVQPLESAHGYTGPVVAPNGVAPSGTIAYIFTHSGSMVMQAVDRAGTALWNTALPFSVQRLSPVFSPSGAWVFWEGHVLDVQSGTVLTQTLVEHGIEERYRQFLSGADGEVYVRNDNRFMPLQATDAGLELAGSGTLWIFGATSQTRVARPRDGGVTPDNIAWLIGNAAFGGGIELTWGLANTTDVADILGTQRLRALNQPKLIGFDRDTTAYVCGNYGSKQERVCYALSYREDDPLWALTLDDDDRVSGGAIVPGRLYVTTEAGRLYAVGGESPGVEPQVEGTEPGDTPAPVDPGPAWARPVVPGGHLWAAEYGDPWGTRWTSAIGPQQASLRWTYENQAGFSGSPVVAADGTLYIGTNAGTLIALNPDSTLRWFAKLAGSTVGSPALGADGTVYITDGAGHLFAFTPEGDLKWRHHGTGVVTRQFRNPVSGEVTREELLSLDGLAPAACGAVVAPDGTIYYSLAVETWTHEADLYVREEVMMTVSPEGESLPGDPPFIFSGRATPRILPGETMLLWADGFLRNRAEELDPEPFYAYLNALLEEDEGLDFRVFSGADGRAYLAYQRTFDAWYLTEDGLGIARSFTWEPGESPGTVTDVGVLSEGLAWMFFRGGKFIWVDAENVVSGPVRFPLESSLIAVDGDGTAYGCGSSMGKALECMAYGVGEMDARWTITLNEGDKLLGGALVPGTLYVATEGGKVYALGD